MRSSGVGGKPPAEIESRGWGRWMEESKYRLDHAHTHGIRGGTTGKGKERQMPCPQWKKGKRGGETEAGGTKGKM